MAGSVECFFAGVIIFTVLWGIGFARYVWRCTHPAGASSRRATDADNPFRRGSE
jgi:hypothetical protein